MAGLEFGMDVETAWRVAPRLRDAIFVYLEPSAFDEVSRRIPELGKGLEGGDREYRHKTRSGVWPEVDGATWELRFAYGSGLMAVTARYETEQALRTTVGAWGQPDIAGRRKVWLDDGSHTRAEFERCVQNSSRPLECNIVLEPQQSPEALLEQVFPKAKTLVGLNRTELDLGEGSYIEGAYTLYQLWPLPATTDWTHLEVQFDGDKVGRVTAYRATLDFALEPMASVRFRDAMRRLVPEPEPGSLLFGQLDGVPIEVNGRDECRFTVGHWKEMAIKR